MALQQNWNSYAEIRKIDEESRIVAGYASTPTVDAAGETITLDAISGALADYMQFANLREMHGNTAAGVVKAASVDDKGLWIEAKVVDNQAWEKVKEGVYKGFSVGGSALARSASNKKIITKMALKEISLVDRPCNAEALISFFKADGFNNDGDAVNQGEGEMAVEKTVPETVQAVVEAPADAVAKSMYTVSELASITARIECLMNEVSWEAGVSADGSVSTTPAQIKELLIESGSALKAMIETETARQASISLPGDPPAPVVIVVDQEGDVIAMSDKSTDIKKVDSVESGAFDLLLKSADHFSTASGKQAAESLQKMGQAALDVIQKSEAAAELASKVEKRYAEQAELIEKSDAKLVELTSLFSERSKAFDEAIELKKGELSALDESLALSIRHIASVQDRAEQISKRLSDLENRPVPPRTSRVVAQPGETQPTISATVVEKQDLFRAAFARPLPR